MKLQVVVIGAGVIGLSVATHLLERFPDDLIVTVIADRYSPDTISSDRSGGLIVPPQTVTGQERVMKWIAGTLSRINSLYNSREKLEIGISLSKGYYIVKADFNIESYQHLFADCRLVEKSEASMLDIDHLEERGAHIVSLSTYTVPCPTYLPWLLKRFTQLGGIAEQWKVNHLSELSSYDIVTNCTGLGARELVNDQQVYPLRGHIVSVNAPWIKQWVNTLSCSAQNPMERAYIFPRNDGIILGGTEVCLHDNYPYTDSEAFERIIRRCKDLVPSLANAQVVSRWVGERPMRRNGVCLEKEETSNPFIIHCYGHGSYGVSMSWGCAEEVGDLVEVCITKTDVVK